MPVPSVSVLPRPIIRSRRPDERVCGGLMNEYAVAYVAEKHKTAAPFHVRGPAAEAVKKLFRDNHASNFKKLEDIGLGDVNKGGYRAIRILDSKDLGVPERGVVAGPLEAQGPSSTEKLLSGFRRWKDTDNEADALQGMRHEMHELTSRGQVPIATHRDVDVLANEGNFLRSLRQAGHKRSTGATIRYRKIVGEEAAIRQVYPWYRHGETRLNRREIKHLSDRFKKNPELAHRALDQRTNQVRAGLVVGATALTGGAILGAKVIKKRRAAQQSLWRRAVKRVKEET